MIPSPTEMQAPERIVIAFNGRGMRCLVLCDVDWNVGGEWVSGGGSERGRVESEEGMKGWLFLPVSHLGC